jgi:Protein of unknown function (DUF4197)
MRSNQYMSTFTSQCILNAGRSATIVLLLLTFASAHAVDLSSISNKDASAGLKAALEKGSIAAVSKLGIENGFLGNDKVKIPLPEALKKAEGLLRMMGQSKKADELVTSMNRAAEAAVPEAKALLVNAVKTMSVQDAKGILTGGDDSVTQYFKTKTSAPLALKFLPIVKKATEKVGLAQQYNHLAGQGQKLGLVGENEASIEQYVTQKTLDGLYTMIGEEEKAIRQDPIGTGSKILQKVFGILK